MFTQGLQPLRTHGSAWSCSFLHEHFPPGSQSHPVCLSPSVIEGVDADRSLLIIVVALIYLEHRILPEMTNLFFVEGMRLAV